MKNFKIIITIFVLFLLTIVSGCTKNDSEEETSGKLYVECYLDNGQENLKIEVTDTSTFEFPTVTKEGYRFYKWYSDEELTEEFIMDEVDVSLLKSDVVINAYAKWKIESYTVNFIADGKILNSQKVQYGKAANAPTVPEKSGYNFVGWDADTTFIKGNITFNAVYEERPLTIKYYNLNTGEEITGLNPTTYERKQTIELPIPTLDGYEFIGWFLSEISLTPYTELDGTYTQDLKLYARFTETVRHKRITLPSATYQITEIRKIANGSGTYVYQPVIPTGAPTGVSNYTWKTSDEDIAKLSEWGSIQCRGLGCCIITGTYKTDISISINCIVKITAEGPVYVTEEEANTVVNHTVTFKDANGNILRTQVVEDGGYAICPMAPIVEGFTFTGWSKDCYNIKEDTVITAIYQKGGNNSYQGKKFAIIGDSISTMYNYIPDGFSFFYPYYTGDTYDINQTWWMQAINKLGGELFVNNSYSGSCVVGTGYATSTDLRLSYTQIYDQSPDVILIYMGSNDGHAEYPTFGNSYREMISKLKALCPNAEIILMELAYSKLYTDTIKDEYNTIINTIGTENGLKVIKTGEVDLKPYLIDSAHPYTAGMTAMANCIVNQLIN